MSKIRKIIFDNDGVNIDSEHLAMRIMDEWGIRFVLKYNSRDVIQDDFIYKNYAGVSTDRIIYDLIEKFNLPLNNIKDDYGLSTVDPSEASIDLADQVTIETIQRFQQELKAVPGVTGTLEKLRKKYVIALATTSREDRMNISLDYAVDPKTGENSRLSELFPAGPLRRSGYGHPNKYDEFFDAVGWDPAECAVVEDSLSGVTKARAAGTARGADLPVVGTVASQFYQDKQAQARALTKAGAKLVVSSMADLPNALAWLEADLAPPLKPTFSARLYLPSDFVGTAPSVGMSSPPMGQQGSGIEPAV
jgi:beta-phosphoglucomutase-like phosphatase (HAD superfamily)